MRRDDDVESHLVGPALHVRLVETDPIYLDAALRIAAHDSITRQADSPLDEVLTGIARQETDEGKRRAGLASQAIGGGWRVGQPSAWVLEHDNLSS